MMLRFATAGLVLSLCLTGCSKTPPAPSAQVMISRGSVQAEAPTTSQAMELIKNDKILEALATKYHLAFNGSRQALVETLRTSLVAERVADTDVYVLSSTLKPRTLALGMLQVWVAEIEEQRANQVSGEAESVRKKLVEAINAQVDLKSQYERLAADRSAETAELKNKLSEAQRRIDELTQTLEKVTLQKKSLPPKFKLVGEEPLKYTAEEINDYISIRRQCRNLPDISFQQSD